MPLFVFVHAWKPEESIAILKEMLAVATAYLEGKTPQGAEMISVYVAGPTRSFCFWKAPSIEVLEKILDQYMPIMKTRTELLPLVQMFPPTIEYTLALWKTMIEAAPK